MLFLVFLVLPFRLWPASVLRVDRITCRVRRLCSICLLREVKGDLDDTPNEGGNSPVRTLSICCFVFCKSARLKKRTKLGSLILNNKKPPY